MNRWNTVNYKCLKCGRIVKITTDEEKRVNDGLLKVRPCKCGSKNFKKVQDQQVTF